MKIILALLLGTLTVPASEKTHRPFKEMKGDCEQFALAKKAEFDAWALPHKSLGAGDALPLGTPAELALAPQGEVKFAVKPEKDPKEGSHAGLLSFTPPASGRYRLSIGAKVWAEMVRGSTLVEPATFEMQTKCSKIFKVVEFPLEGGQPYVLQLSSSRANKARVLLTKVR